MSLTNAALMMITALVADPVAPAPWPRVIAHPQPLLVEEGQRALRERQFAQAYAVLGPLAAVPKAAPELRFWAAEAALGMQDCSLALTHLQHLELELALVGDEIYARKARCHAAMGDAEEALSAWHEVLLRHPTAALGHEARYAMGPLWLLRGNPVAAVVAFKDALERGPRDLRADEARLQVAVLEQSVGNVRGAQKDFAHLVMTARDDIAQKAAEALEQLSVSLGQEPTQRPDVPAKDDDVDGVPSWQTVKMVRDAQRLLAQKRVDQAIVTLRRQLGHGGRNERSAVAWALGNMLAQLGRTKEAVETFDMLARGLPHHKKADAQFRAAFLCYDGKQYTEAQHRFAHFLGAHPRHKNADEALWFSAWCLFHLKRYDRALVELTRLRRQFPNSSLYDRAQWWSARTLLLRSRDSEAQKLIAALASRRGYYGLLARQQQKSPIQQKLPVQPVVQLPTTPLKQPQLSDALDPGSAMSDDEATAFMMSQGTQALDWSSAEGARVSTLITLGLGSEAAMLLDTVRGMPGLSKKDLALGRGQILFALGNYTLAMRQAELILPDKMVPDPDPWHEMALRLAYPPAYSALATAASQRFEVSALLLLSLMRQESAFNSKARSTVSAQGLMQIMPATARKISQELGENSEAAPLDDPKQNIALAGWYMAALLKRFDHNLPVAIGSYNAGPKAVQKWLMEASVGATDVYVEDIPYRETRDYVKKVLANLEMYSFIYGNDAPSWPATVKPASLGVDF